MLSIISKSLVLLWWSISSFHAFRISRAVSRQFTKSSTCVHETEDSMYDLIQVEQWNSFIEYHTGNWCGIQSCHFHDDEESSSATEKILCGNLLKVSEDKDSVTHSNFLVSGTLDFSTDDLVNSDRIMKQEVGVYNIPIISSKMCANVALGGPGMSREGLTIQVCLKSI